MKVAVAFDHRGVHLRDAVLEAVAGHEILDFGTDRSCEVADSVWQKHKDGEKLKLEVRASSGDVVCDSL